MLYYDRHAMKIVAVPEDLEEYACPRCTCKRPVEKDPFDIVCVECGLVLLTR